MDDESQVFAHQIELVRSLSRHFHKILVITGKYNDKCVLPNNVYVFSFNWIQGSSFKNLINFSLLFTRVILSKRVNLVFSHMTDVHAAIMSIPLKVMRKPHVLWYAHTSQSKFLLWSSIFVERIVTSTFGSCPIKNRKVVAIGQAINHKIFYSPVKKECGKRKFIHIGRIDPSKNIEKIISTIMQKQLKYSDLNLIIVGKPSSEKYFAYAENLIEANRGIDYVQFHNMIYHNQIPIYLREFDGFVHAFNGSLDKTILEATISGIPVITSNREYIDIFGTWNRNNELLSLDSEFEAFLNTSEEQIRSKCAARQNKAIQDHSLEQWENKLLTVFDDLIET